MIEILVTVLGIMTIIIFEMSTIQIIKDYCEIEKKIRLKYSLREFFC